MILPCVSRLARQLRTAFPQSRLPARWQIVPEPCPEEMHGDITVNCFRLARLFRTAPESVAEQAAAILNADPDVKSAERIKAFVNVTLHSAALCRDTVGDLTALMSQALLPEEARRRILVEYSAPNTNKPQHLGHVRNNIIGMSLCALLARVGHDVIPVNLVNDRGIHICKSMLAYQRFGHGDTPENTSVKGDHFVGDYYVRYNAELKKQLAALRRARPELAAKTDDELFLATEIGAAAQEMLRQWENSDPETIALWKKMNSWVIAGFNATYRRMGVEFRKTYLESQTWLFGRDIVRKGLADGVFERREDGAVTADLGKLGVKTLLRKDGTSVYITQDLGTTLLKQREFEPQTMIWVVGDEQILHFKMLFAILNKMGYAWAAGLHHLAYGMVNLPSGRMKSREGTVVDADDLFDAG